MSEPDKPNPIGEILCAWEALDAAAMAIQTAQPFQLTAAAERLEGARLHMRTTIFAHFVRAPEKDVDHA